MTDSTREVLAYTNYGRILELEAVDGPALRSTREPEPMWKLTAANTGDGNDLRGALPCLLIGAELYIATPSH